MIIYFPEWHGKIKFGSTQGTFGQVPPRDSKFFAKIENLLSPEELTDCTDVVVIVGTNDLKPDGADPTVLAVRFYEKMKVYWNTLSNTRIYVNVDSINVKAVTLES